MRGGPISPPLGETETLSFQAHCALPRSAHRGVRYCKCCQAPAEQNPCKRCLRRICPFRVIARPVIAATCTRLGSKMLPACRVAAAMRRLVSLGWSGTPHLCAAMLRTAAAAGAADCGPPVPGSGASKPPEQLLADTTSVSCAVRRWESRSHLCMAFDLVITLHYESVDSCYHALRTATSYLSVCLFASL